MPAVAGLFGRNGRCTCVAPKVALWLFISAVVQSSVVHAAEALTPNQIQEIKALSEATLVKDGLPALSVALVKGEYIWSAAFGKADLEQDVAADTRSMIRTASVSKWFTSTAAMRLVEDGKLDLDAPIQQYCPQFPKKQATITPRLLLSHLAGFRNYRSSGANGEPRATEQDRKVLDDLIKREESFQFTRYTDVIKPLDNFKDEPLLFDPGTRFFYTSLSYRVLSCVLEGAAQTPFRTLMRNLVFAPAGMTIITEDDALAIVPHRASGYSRNKEKQITRAPFRDVSENLAAGGYLSNAEDLVRFAAAFNADKLVKPTSRQLMIARPKLRDGTEVKDSFGMYYGMGIFVASTSSGEQLLMHTGMQAGTTTELILLPKSGIAVAVMVNIDGWGGRDSLAKKIAEIAGRPN